MKTITTCYKDFITYFERLSFLKKLFAAGHYLSNISPFHATGLLYTPLKTSENL